MKKISLLVEHYNNISLVDEQPLLKSIFEYTCSEERAHENP